MKNEGEVNGMEVEAVVIIESKKELEELYTKHLIQFLKSKDHLTPDDMMVINDAIRILERLQRRNVPFT